MVQPKIMEARNPSHGRNKNGNERAGSASATTTRRRRLVALWGSASLFPVHAAALLAFHAATAAETRTGRAANEEEAVPPPPGPADEFPALSPLDRILFGALVLMAFELLDFITKNSGSKLPWTRVLH